MLNKVSFGGLYYIHFPKTYNAKDMKAEHKKLQNFIEANNLERSVQVQMCANAENIIGVATNVTLPMMHYKLFEQISPSLAEQYKVKTAINLYV